MRNIFFFLLSSRCELEQFHMLLDTDVKLSEKDKKKFSAFFHNPTISILLQKTLLLLLWVWHFFLFSPLIGINITKHERKKVCHQKRKKQKPSVLLHGYRHIFNWIFFFRFKPEMILSRELNFKERQKEYAGTSDKDYFVCVCARVFRKWEGWENKR